MKKKGFDVNALFASLPVSSLIRWYNKPGDIAKEFREKAIQFYRTFYGLLNGKLQTGGVQQCTIFALLMKYLMSF